MGNAMNGMNEVSTRAPVRAGIRPAERLALSISAWSIVVVAPALLSAAVGLAAFGADNASTAFGVAGVALFISGMAHLVDRSTGSPYLAAGMVEGVRSFLLRLLGSTRGIPDYPRRLGAALDRSDDPARRRLGLALRRSPDLFDASARTPRENQLLMNWARGGEEEEERAEAARVAAALRPSLTIPPVPFRRGEVAEGVWMDWTGLDRQGEMPDPHAALAFALAAQTLFEAAERDASVMEDPEWREGLAAVRSLLDGLLQDSRAEAARRRERAFDREALRVALGDGR